MELADKTKSWPGQKNKRKKINQKKNQSKVIYVSQAVCIRFESNLSISTLKEIFKSKKTELIAI
jgi:hypothetical protein